MNPARSSPRPTPALAPPDRPRLSRPRARIHRVRLSRGRAGSPGRSRCARASAPAGRTAAGRCARATWSPSTRSRPPGLAPTPSAWSCPATIPPTAWPATPSTRSMDLCLQCKACKTECPSNVDMAKLKAEYPPPEIQDPAGPVRLDADGPHPSPQPARLGDGPAGQRDLDESGLQVAPRERSPGSTAGGPCRPSPPTTSAAGSADPRGPTPGPGTRGTVVLMDDCFTTYNNPKVGRAAVAVLEAGGYRVELAGLPCCGRPAISKGLLDLGRSLARENVARGWSTTPARGRRSWAASRVAC